MREGITFLIIISCHICKKNGIEGMQFFKPVANKRNAYFGCQIRKKYSFQ
jgi:hypothetical protein